MRRPFRLSVTTHAAILVVVVVTVSLGVIGIIDYRSTRNDVWARLRADAASEADQMAAALALPLWNFDRAQIHKVVESLLKERDVYAVVVRHADVSASGGVAKYARARDENWEVTTIDEEPPVADLLTEDRDVTTGSGDMLGSVRVYVTPRFAESIVWSNLVRLVKVILLLDALLSAGLCLVLWCTVLKPLKEIEHYAASVVRDGAASNPSRPWVCRELVSLRHSIEQMVRLLRTRLGVMQKNEEMLTTVINAVPHCIFWKDVRGVYLGGNEVLADTTGLQSTEEIRGKTDFDFPWPQADAEAYRADDLEVLRTKQPKRHIIEPVRRADGNLRWTDTTKVPLLDANGVPCGVLGVAEDITERREGEEALRREKALTEALFDNVPALLCLFDEQKRPIRWNVRGRESTGYSDEEVAGAHPLLWDSEETRVKVVGALDKVLQEGRADLEADFVTKSGKQIPFYFTGIRLVLEGKPHILAIGMDISERKRAEEDLRRALLEAEAASRAKDHFLAAASHELRTPLTPVLLLTSSLEADQHIPAEARQDLAVIREHIEVEKRLIGDLLDFTAIHAGKLHMNAVSADVHEVLRAAIRTCEKDIERKEQHLETHFDAKAHYTSGDPDRLRQVFWNLLQNAVKFTSNNGSITVRTSDDGAQWLRVEVADTGMGMEPEMLQKLFRPFEQGPRKTVQHYGGLGLGLAISKTLVEAHGGSISATSMGTGRGSTFIVRLPVSVPTKPPHPTASRLPPVAPPRLRLLLVEDHPLTLKTLRRLLVAEGHEVTTATTIAEAIASAERARFDLVLSDIGLPDGSGCDLMPVLGKRFGLPGIALSGFGAEGDVEASRNAGFLFHLTKPVTMEGLREALARFAALWPQPPSVRK